MCIFINQCPKLMLFSYFHLLSVNYRYSNTTNSIIFCIFAWSDMKYKDSRCYFIEERDADLLRAYKEIINVRDNIRLSEIEEKLAQSPSRRFWVSEDRAYIVILDLLKGKPLDNMIPTRKEMYQEIFRRFQIHKSNEPYLSNMDIIKRVCAEKAPSFYLTPQSIHVILSRVRKEEKQRCYERRKRRLRFMLGTL